jgi:hypothetical protein
MHISDNTGIKRLISKPRKLFDRELISTVDNGFEQDQRRSQSTDWFLGNDIDWVYEWQAELTIVERTFAQIIAAERSRRQSIAPISSVTVSTQLW